jgi:phage portal protein BeeE
MPLRDQQFIEQGQFTVTQIATLFNMPASKINGQTGDSLTYGTREQDAIAFVTQTLLPWMNRTDAGAVARQRPVPVPHVLPGVPAGGAAAGRRKAAPSSTRR